MDIKLTPEQKVLLKTAREAKEAALKALQEAQTAYVGAQQRVLEEHGYIPGLVVGVGDKAAPVVARAFSLLFFREIEDVAVRLDSAHPIKKDGTPAKNTRYVGYNFSVSEGGERMELPE